MESLEARRRPLGSMPWSRRVAEILVPVSPSTSRDDLETWLLARIAGSLGADPLGIDPTLPPAVYGFEGAPARALTRELERRLGRSLPADVFACASSVRAAARGLCTDTPPRCLPHLPTREEMRRHLLARAARLPRRPSTDPGEGPAWGRAGCSPSERTLAGSVEPDTDLALAS